jgi:hypothetical protein
VFEGLRNNVVAIMPFLFQLSMMQDPAAVNALAFDTNFTFLEDVRRQVETGEGLQRCDKACITQGEGHWPMDNTLYHTFAILLPSPPVSLHLPKT